MAKGQKTKESEGDPPIGFAGCNSAALVIWVPTFYTILLLDYASHLKTCLPLLPTLLALSFQSGPDLPW